MRRITFNFIDGTSITEYRRTINPERYIEEILSKKHYNDDKGRIIVVDKIKFITYD